MSLTPERRREIRSYAVRRVAAELNAVVNHWSEEVQEELYPDPEERAVFQAVVDSEIRRLQRRGGAPEPTDPSR